jgi:predicted ferric reductase
MNVRRGILWAASVVFGLVSSAGVILVFQTTLEKFSVVNAFLVFASFAALAFIWLDWILQTKYLRS